MVGDLVQDELAPSLALWSEARGWGFETLRLGGTDLGAAASAPGVMALVVRAEGGAVSLESEVPVVVVGGVGSSPGPRLSVVGPARRDDQAAFLAGAMAGLVSRTGVVGLIGEAGGEGDSLYVSAFTHGLRYGCPRCSLAPVDAGEAGVADLVGQWADVAFIPPGSSADTTAGGAAEAGMWVVWVGSAPQGVASERLAGGIGQDPGPVVVRALEGLLAGEAGQSWRYAVENGGLVLTGLNPEALSPGRERILHVALEELASGVLEIGVDPISGAEW